MTACGIELLDDRGKVNVASVQQIAFRDLKHLVVDVGKLLIDNKNRSSVVLERQMLYTERVTLSLDPKVQGENQGKEEKFGSGGNKS